MAYGKTPSYMIKNATMLCLIIPTFFIMSACSRDESFRERTRSTGPNVRYFKSFVSYQLPIRPAGEIRASEAEKLAADNNAYYEALYDQSGKLLTLTKHYAGRMETHLAYAYRKEGRIERCTITHPTNPEFGKIEEHFDSSDKLEMVMEYDKQGEVIRENNPY